MKLKFVLFPSIFVLILNISPVLAYAQADPGDDPDGNTNVPFDGGVSFLVAAGISYGIKKGFNHNKKDEVL